MEPEHRMRKKGLGVSRMLGLPTRKPLFLDGGAVGDKVFLELSLENRAAT